MRLDRDPEALLKIFRPDSENDRTGPNTNGNGTESGSKKPGEEGGGSTDVQLIHSLSEIEQVLVNAGDEQAASPAEGISGSDAVQPVQQRKQPPLLQLVSHSQRRSIDGDSVSVVVGEGYYATDTAPQHDVSCQATERDGGVRPGASTSKAGKNEAGLITGEQSTAAPYAGCSGPSTGLVATESKTEGATNLHICSASAGVIRRPRPWAVQKFLRPKGPLAW